MEISKISFPGLGIGEFEVSDTAFTVFGHEIKWYGIIIAIGMICAFSYFLFRAKRAGIKADTVIDFTLFTIPIGVIGARLYFVVFYGVPFADIYKIWEGGLAIYGGIIFGAATVIIMCRIKKVKFFALADMIVLGVMIAQAIGRWGNFMNGEAFGSETDAFCRMGLNNWHTGYQTIFVHPTFLYESLWNVIGFILINIFYKKRKFNGEILAWYVGWYGLGRTFIELLRTDSLYIGGSGIRVSSLVGAICFAVCLPLVILMRVKHAQKVKAGKIDKDDISDMAFLLDLFKKDADKSPDEIAAEKTEISDKTEDEPGEQNIDSRGDGAPEDDDDGN